MSDPSDNTTSSVNSIRRLLEVTGRTKVNPKDLLIAADIDPFLLKTANNRVPNSKISHLTRNSIERTGNVALGLHIGELSRPGLFDILGHAVMCCRTLRESFDITARFIPLIGDSDRMTVTMERDYAMITYEPVNLLPDYSKTCSEIAMASLIVNGRWLTERKIKPIEVHFQYAQPAYMSEYRRIFGSAISFEQNETRLILERGDLDYPLNQANPELLSTLIHQAEEKLAGLSTRQSFSDQVAELLAPEIKRAEPHIGTTAEKLMMSVRTLQRRLREENTSYQKVLDQTRNQAAKRLLHEAFFSHDDITSLLGFSSTSSFFRSFKRWNGLTPGEFLRQ